MDQLNAAEITWWQHPDEARAHAFVATAGWMRSSCRSIRWTVLLRSAGPRAWRCPDCVAAVAAGVAPESAMSEPEAAAAFGR
jgi:hypothetical protein